MVRATEDPIHAGGTRPGIGGSLLIPVGLGVFLLCGVFTALLAARILQPLDYTIYASFSSLWGIALLASAGAFEQESSLRATGGKPTSRLFRDMAQRGAVVWLVTCAVLCVPVLGWQDRLLGDDWPRWIALAGAGGLMVYAAAILRGIGTGRGRFGTVGASNAATGVAMPALPLTLIALGSPPIAAFLAGAVGAWGAGLLVLVLAASRGAFSLRGVESDGASGPHSRITGWMVGGNLLMTASVLAVPSVLRWHVADIGAEVVAEAQLLVNISRLASTLVLGLLPVMMASMRSRPDRFVGFTAAKPWLVVAVGVGFVAVAVLAAVGVPLVGWITGRPPSVELRVALAAAGPVLLLAPAVVLMALAAARGRYLLIVLAWAASLAALGGAVVIDPGGGIFVVLGWVGLSTLLPLGVFLVGLSQGGSSSTAAVAGHAPAGSSD